MRAGWQLRILSQMQPNCNLFVDQLCAIAATEAAEASLLLSSTPGTVTPCAHTVLHYQVRTIRLCNDEANRV